MSEILCTDIFGPERTRLLCFMWSVLFDHRFGISALGLVMCALTDSGSGSNGVKIVAANALAILSIKRVRRAMEARQPPRWAARALRVLPPSWLTGTMDADPPPVPVVEEAL